MNFYTKGFIGSIQIIYSRSKVLCKTRGEGQWKIGDLKVSMSGGLNLERQLDIKCQLDIKDSQKMIFVRCIYQALISWEQSYIV